MVPAVAARVEPKMGMFRNQSSNLFYRARNGKPVVARQKLVLRDKLVIFLPHSPAMTSDLDIRRPIRRISRADLARYPVWEWALHEEETTGQGESFVRPTALECIPLDSDRQYVAAATATLSDGSVLPACAEVTVRNGKAKAVPMFIFLLDRHLDFAGPATQTTLTHYTKTAQVRPVSWKLNVPLAGHSTPPGGTVRRSLWSRLRRLLGRGSSDSALVRV